MAARAPGGASGGARAAPRAGPPPDPICAPPARWGRRPPGAGHKPPPRGPRWPRQRHAAKGRKLGFLAGGDLGVVEGVAVAGDGRASPDAPGLRVWMKPRPRSCRARRARPPGARAGRCARRRAGRPGRGRHRHPPPLPGRGREVVALGDELGAHHHVHLALRHGIQLGPCAPPRRAGRRRAPGCGRWGTASAPLPGGAPTPGRRTMGPWRRSAGIPPAPGGLIAAMMAGGRRRKPDAPPATRCRRGTAVAAGIAQRERRIAPPVEEQQRYLPTGCQRVVDFRLQARRDPAAARRTFAPKIDGREARHLGAAEAHRQRKALVAPFTSVSMEGVAEASTMGAAHRRARTTACRGRGSTHHRPACRRGRAPHPPPSGRGP